MAESIKDGNVTDFSAHRAKAKGRPKGSRNKAKAQPAVNSDAEALAQSTGEQSRGYGHNQLDEGSFLRWVERLNRHEDKGEALKLALKTWRGERKDLRTTASGEGMGLGELDDAVRDLKTERVDLEAKEERRRLYRTWLGLPAGTQGALPLPKTDAEAEKQRWHRRGDQDGRLGKARVNPDGCPPERLQDYFEGWEAGQGALMRGSTLLGEGFKDKAADKPSAEEGAPAATEGAEKGPLILSEADFIAGTPLDDANLRTLLKTRRANFDAAERVVALFGIARRILKEPDPNLPGGAYIDDGDQAPISDVEEVEPSAPTAAELA